MKHIISEFTEEMSSFIACDIANLTTHSELCDFSNLIWRNTRLQYPPLIKRYPKSVLQPRSEVCSLEPAFFTDWISMAPPLFYFFLCTINF